MNTRHTALMLLGLTMMTTHGLAQKSQHPEAYAGLPDSAYQPIKLSQNKSSGLSFEFKGQSILIPGSQNKAAKSGTSHSFSQLIEGGFISATMGEGSLFGEMHLNNKHHILTTNEHGIWAVELPSEGLSYNQCGVDHEQHQHRHKALNQSLIAPIQPKAAGTNIDVLIVHDQAFADRYPGALLDTRIDQYFHVSNQAYANSGIDLSIRKVGTEYVSYNFNNTNFEARNNMQQALLVSGAIQGFEDLKAMRENTGADLVIFLRNHNIETRGSCGIAFFPVALQGSNGGELDSSYGVNVMADGMSSWSVCTDQLMVHEIGHNLSAGHHNWDPTQFGIDPNARGFAKIGQYGTVMGSFGTGQPDRFFELDVFSNPSVQCGGAPCGIVGTANNAQVIDQFKTPISEYMPVTSNIPLPDDFFPVDLDQDGDGVLDSMDEFPFLSTETKDSDGDGVGDNADAFPNDSGEQSDFDQDGIGDVADFDDDGDGILDQDDDFPLDPNEVKDSDLDGVGDIADAFVFEQSEQSDFDDDGIGNHSDPDDDGDGVNELNSEKQDLLVISVGNNRILRFDAQTGQSKGIEVLPDDGVLTFQSDLAVDQRTQRLYYSSASQIRSISLLNRDVNPTLVIPPYSTTGVQLGTGFPTALEFDDASSLITAKLQSLQLDAYDQRNINNIQQYFYSGLGDSTSENIIDLKTDGSQLYALGLNRRIYRGDLGQANMVQVGNGSMPWLVDPYSFVVRSDGSLLHTDQSRDKILITDGQTGGFIGEFADLDDQYSNPTGIELTSDGRVLVALADQNKILEFNANTGELLGELVSGAGLDEPHKMVLVQQLDDRFHADAGKVLRPNAGSWDNPATTGRGFNIGIFGDRLQVLWYTYDEAGLPIWYFSADFLNGHVYDTELLRAKQVSDTEVTFETVGQIQITFANEREAEVSWQIGSESATEPINWLQFSLEPEINNYTGLWSRADTPGWGIAVTTIGERSIMIPFIYDGDGEPRWVISDVANGDQPFQFNMSTVFSDSLCPGCTGNSPTEFEPSGTMDLSLMDNTATWSSALDWADPVPGNWDLDGTEIVRISSPPTRPR